MSETLEQVAEKLYPVFYRSTPFGSKYPWIPQKEREAFKRGAKWQQERSYSEEEVEILLETLSKVLVYQGNEYILPFYFQNEIKQVVEQFKKK